jgi:ADP-heptose:LPS heptosyltransferase
MNYLIFRTDRIGDCLIISPLLHAIKKKDIDANIFVVSSPKNDVFINKNILADKVFLLKKKLTLTK